MNKFAFPIIIPNNKVGIGSNLQVFEDFITEETEGGLSVSGLMKNLEKQYLPKKLCVYQSNKYKRGMQKSQSSDCLSNSNYFNGKFLNLENEKF